MIWIEAFKMAMGAIRAHKLRSFLTLVGIIAGVASIIAVMTGISVIQATMEQEMSVLGSTTFQVQKWPAGGFNNDADWRKIQQRKPVTVANADAVREKVKTVDLVGAELWRFGSTAKFKDKTTNSNLWLCGGTKEYPPNNTHYVEFGKNITDEDVRVGRKVGVIGYEVAETLFPFIDPIGQVIKVDGHKLRVIGVFEEKKTAMGGNFDNYILLPVTTLQRAYGMRDERRGGERSVNMTVNAISPDMVDTAIEETRAVLRLERGVGPREEDDFTIFTNDSQIRTFNQATQGVKIGAFVIGIVALVVAGIGIMNIMLVSVTERTKEIGVRKAIGAKRRHILLQFLLEAIVLCNVGGVIGVVVGFGLGNIVTFFTDFAVNVPMNWAVIGVAFCTTIGLTFGLWPAMKASKLAPIDALSYE
jgi:putative ABC transport system permease protein